VETPIAATFFNLAAADGMAGFVGLVLEQPDADTATVHRDGTRPRQR
jgi:hypothetical protein